MPAVGVVVAVAIVADPLSVATGQARQLLAFDRALITRQQLQVVAEIEFARRVRMAKRNVLRIGRVVPYERAIRRVAGQSLGPLSGPLMVGNRGEGHELADMVFCGKRGHAKIRRHGEARIGFQHRAGEVIGQARSIERCGEVDIRIGEYPSVARVLRGQARQWNPPRVQLRAAQRKGLKAHGRRKGFRDRQRKRRVRDRFGTKPRSNSRSNA